MERLTSGEDSCSNNNDNMLLPQTIQHRLQATGESYPTAPKHRKPWPQIRPSLRRPKRRSQFLRASIVLVLAPGIFYFLTYTLFGSSSSSSYGEGVNDFHKRHLMQSDDADDQDSTNEDAIINTPANSSFNSNNSSSGEEEKDLFPEDLFTDEQLRQGAVVLHILGVIYMFYALALVCDEYFVPSLDVITEKLNISPDVAGATFMAAGGSAPELFTSVIGVFVAKNDVGIGTIVGSAVFNILFVIAACAFAAKEALSLTAWPLVRDVFFYSVSLIVLVLFFQDNHIYWYEALVLFIWYFVYVGFMKFNDVAEDLFRRLFRMEKADREKKVYGVTLRQAKNRKGLYHLMNETINPGILKRQSQNKRQSQIQEGEETVPLYKQGIAIGEGATATGGISQLKNHLQESEAAQVDKANQNGPEASQSKDSKVLKIVESKHLMASEVEVEAAAVAAAEEQQQQQQQQQLESEEDEGEEPIDMCFPKDGGWKKILVYVLTFPILFPLFLTLPDTKNPKKRKFFVITFVGSIIWIALYSYLMVWWATVAGDVIGIPPEVMGLTFIAAGTSVPDLITSVLVAKQGKGDMAVSSSVGSNIFDVCVGLPFPWLLYTAINQTHVAVSSEGLGCSVTLLFFMLISVFLCIVAFNWKMTKSMGSIMLVLYFVFVVVTLGFTYGWYKCPI